DFLHHLGMIAGGGPGEQVVAESETTEVLGDLPRVEIGRLVGGTPLVVGLHQDRCAVLVRTGNHEHVVPDHALVPCENVRGDTESGHVADVTRAVRVRPRDRRQHWGAHGCPAYAGQRDQCAPGAAPPPAGMVGVNDVGSPSSARTVARDDRRRRSPDTPAGRRVPRSWPHMDTSQTESATDPNNQVPGTGRTRQPISRSPSDDPYLGRFPKAPAGARNDLSHADPRVLVTGSPTRLPGRLGFLTGSHVRGFSGCPGFIRSSVSDTLGML